MIQYNSEVYECLQDIDVVKKNPSYSPEIIIELGRIILKYNWVNDMSVSLIHRHFHLDFNEKMIADFDFKKEEWMASPLRVKEEYLIPYNWKIEYNLNEGKWDWVPLDFLPDILKFKEQKQLVERLKKSKIFLDELANSYAAHGVQDIFGLSLLMPTYNFSDDGTVLFEQNDINTRTSRSFFIPKSTLSNPDAITHWFFNKSSEQGEDYLKTGPLKWCDHI